MKFKVIYSQEIEADSRQGAIMRFPLKGQLSPDAHIIAEPLCPKGKEKGSCYEQCAYRENGMCNLDHEF